MKQTGHATTAINIKAILALRMKVASCFEVQPVSQDASQCTLAYI